MAESDLMTVCALVAVFGLLQFDPFGRARERSAIGLVLVLASLGVALVLVLTGRS